MRDIKIPLLFLNILLCLTLGLPGNDASTCGCGCRSPCKVNTERACETLTLNLKCGPGESIIVAKANYGRISDRICTINPSGESAPIGDQNCINQNSLAIVNEYCANKNSCAIPATNGVFGDLCYGTYKYLEVGYVCVQN
ncbi:L-rhamnose-binding lectin ELEL-1-like [Bradysia coprophila]|uniref:L-rhamnose-binding lectin ELEL-1-like n=1 Tax=Bradysia coprophila TaxID=38358 RepID=UPI00187DBEA3|nr:L-rhamnose-binding lectin ELEL-1-like [Bradysia coprophila]